MSRIVLLCAVLPYLVCLISAIYADQAESLQGILRQLPVVPIPPYVPRPCDGTKLTTCQSCDTIQLCIGGQSNGLTLTRKCPSSTPYCVQSGSQTGAVCKSAPDSDCPASVASGKGFICTGTGFFPDPDSCQSYHYCEQKDQAGDTYDCPIGYRYNSRTQICNLSILRRCETVKCEPNSQKVFIPYPLDSTYYVYCQYDYATAIPTFVKSYILSCGKGSTFDAQGEMCKFQCKKAGLFVNTANPNQYFSCYLQGLRLTASVNTCSKPNYIFDEKLMRCQKDPNAIASNVNPIQGDPEIYLSQLYDKVTTYPIVSTVNQNDSTVVPKASTVVPSTLTVDTNTVDPKTSKVHPDASTVYPNAPTVNPNTSIMNPNAPSRLADSAVVKTNCLAYLRDLMRKSNLL